LVLLHLTKASYFVEWLWWVWTLPVCWWKYKSSWMSTTIGIFCQRNWFRFLLEMCHLVCINIYIGCYIIVWFLLIYSSPNFKGQINEFDVFRWIWNQTANRFNDENHIYLYTMIYFEYDKITIVSTAMTRICWRDVLRRWRVCPRRETDGWSRWWTCRAPPRRRLPVTASK